MQQRPEVIIVGNAWAKYKFGAIENAIDLAFAVLGHPAEEILDELKTSYRETEKGLFVTSGSHVCSKLIFAACDAAAEILNIYSGNMKS